MTPMSTRRQRDGEPTVGRTRRHLRELARRWACRVREQQRNNVPGAMMPMISEGSNPFTVSARLAPDETGERVRRGQSEDLAKRRRLGR